MVAPQFVAVAVVLLAWSGLLVRSLGQLLGVRPGFDPTHLLTMRINRAPNWSRDSIGRFYDLALARIAQVPGVFGPTDGPKAPLVALINEAAARAYWPGQDPIGRTFATRWNDATSSPGDTVTIVGIIGDVRYRAMEAPPRPDLYVPYQQQQLSARMMFFIRTPGDPAALTVSVRSAIREVAPGFPLSDIQTMESRVGWSMDTARFSAMLLGAFAAVALILAAIGTYGVVSFGVAQRTREIGVRVALGATASDVIGLIVGQGMVLAAVGGAFGLAGALATTRLLRSHLYGVQPSDPVTLVSIVALLLLAVLLASWIPARRAAGVPAVEALRGG